MAAAEGSAAGRLFVVSTPIGNLGDITRRAVEVLASAHAVAAEDTRRTRALLAHLGVGHKPVLALHAHSSDAAVADVARVHPNSGAQPEQIENLFPLAEGEY